jgi:hypothetical protein
MQVSGTDNMGREGINHIAIVVNRMGYVWRETTSADVGFDVEIEIVEEGHATGKIIKVQSKAGASYIRSEREKGFTYYSDINHMAYWQGATNPVILIVYDPKADKAYWIDIKGYAQANPLSTSTSLYKILFDKQATEFSNESKADLLGLFEPTPRKQIDSYCQHVVNQYSKLTLYSVKSDKPLAVELERVFVKLSMTKTSHSEIYRDRFYEMFDNDCPPGYIDINGECVETAEGIDSINKLPQEEEHLCARVDYLFQHLFYHLMDKQIFKTNEQNFV